MTQGPAYQAPKAGKRYAEEIAYVPHAAFLKEVPVFVGEVMEQESVLMPTSSDEDVSPKLKGAVWCNQKSSCVGSYSRKEYLAIIGMAAKECPSVDANEHAVFDVDRLFHNAGEVCAFSEKRFYLREFEASVDGASVGRIC